MTEMVELTILMPCLNEEETLGACIRKGQEFLLLHGVEGEVLVADNGSSDASRKIAAELGARVVVVDEKGYGSALTGGIAAARGKYIVMGDADDSYDFTSIMPFLERLRDGCDLVMGNRFKGGIRPGAMPALHRYLGNPVLTAVGRVFFRSPAGDFHCGLRGFSSDAARRMEMSSAGMEFASEMVIKATLLGMRIEEVPTVLHPDGRSRPPPSQNLEGRMAPPSFHAPLQSQLALPLPRFPAYRPRDGGGGPPGAGPHHHRRGGL